VGAASRQAAARGRVTRGPPPVRPQDWTFSPRGGAQARLYSANLRCMGGRLWLTGFPLCFCEKYGNLARTDLKNERISTLCSSLCSFTLDPTLGIALRYSAAVRLYCVQQYSSSKSEEQSAGCGQEWSPECRHECRVKSDLKSAFILPRSDSILKRKPDGIHPRGPRVNPLGGFCLL
jgi:hypothetical protein